MALYELLDEVAEAERSFSLYEEGAEVSSARSRSLEDTVLERLRTYARDLHGHRAVNMYSLIMPQLERPLLRVAMELARGRQLHAAQMLGIHRNTLRQRLRSLGLPGNEGKRA